MDRQTYIHKPVCTYAQPEHYMPPASFGMRGHKKQTLQAILYLQIKASFRGQNRDLWGQRSRKCMLKYVTSDVDLDLNDGDTVSKP